MTVGLIRHTGVLASIVLAIGLTADHAAAQWRSGGEYGRGRLFSLPRSQDDVFEWEQARRDAREGRLTDAVERLHDLLRSGRPGVVPLDSIGERFMGLRAAVIATLRDLPPEGRSAYEKLTQREAGRLLRSAFETNDREQLTSLARDFPASTGGVRARIRLGDLALEAGNGIDAEFHYRTALDGTPKDAPWRDALRTRMEGARVVRGGHPGSGDDGAIQAELAPALPARGGSRSTNSYGGGADGDGQMAEPLGDLQFQYSIDVRALGFHSAPFPMHAVGDINGIVVNDGLALASFDPLTGRELWRAPGPMLEDPDIDIDNWALAINNDMVLSAACTGDVVVAALQVPKPGQTTRFRHIDVIRRIPGRRLFAVDRATGKRLWSHYDYLGGPVANRFEGHDAAAPPLIWGDTVYVASHDQTGAIAYYLSAYDLRTGEPRWRQLICSSQGEVNMFGNSRQEYAGSALAVADGMIIGSTNLGVCFAADASDGSLRWVTAYEVIPLPQTRLTDQQPREVIFANNILAVTDGVMGCTPLDSAYALGFDIATGQRLWQLHHAAHRDTDMRWLLGAIGDEFIFSGLGVVAAKARPEGRTRSKPDSRTVRRTDSLGLHPDGPAAYTVPRGALTEDRVYYASRAGLRVFDREGIRQSQRMVTPELGLGNLLLVDGILVSVRSSSVDLYYHRDKLVQSAEQQVQRNPDDPNAMLRLASLLRGSSPTSSRAKRAEELYRRGLEVARARGMGPSSPTYRRLAVEVFGLTVERAESLRSSRPAAALDLMRTARDGALGSADWIAAQKTILEWVQSDRTTYLRELQRLADTHGDAVSRFDRLGRVPVAAFVLWQTASHTADPVEAVEACQVLMERFPDLRFADQPVRDLARETQGALIEKHGAKIYARIEERADDMLAAAGEDASLLRSLTLRYPHSDAARIAVRTIMDLAIERGDLATAARSYGTALAESQVGPGVYRRLMQAARSAGNPALAGELGSRLLTNHADEISDYGPDAGAQMRQVVTVDAPIRHRMAPPSKHPLGVVATKTPGRSSIGLRICRSRVVEGFPAPERELLFVSVDGRWLEAFDPSRQGDMFEDPVFSVPFRYQEGEDLLLCGETLVLAGIGPVRAIDLETGREKWSHAEAKDRRLISLGCQAGVLHLFDEHVRASDGGRLWGVEPVTGTVLFQRAFPGQAISTPPASTGNALWVFDPGARGKPHLRRIDPLNGEVTDVVPLRAPLLRKLGLSDADQLYVERLHRSLVADADTVYLPVAKRDGSPPRVAAIDFDGKERWSVWNGLSNRALEMVALHGETLVVVEAGSRGGRLVVLDRDTGSIRREWSRLGPNATVRNWSRTQHSLPAPDVLVLIDYGQSRRPSNLTCYALDASQGSFQHSMRGQSSDLIRDPVLGSDFIAVAGTNDDGNLSLQLLDLKTRRSLLPGGRTKAVHGFRSPLRMYAAGKHVAIQHNGGISILGESDAVR